MCHTHSNAIRVPDGPRLITGEPGEGVELDIRIEDSISKREFYELVIRAYSSPACVRLYANRLFAERRPPVRRAIDKFVEILPTNASVLDLGCGIGKDVAYLRAKSLQAIGMDISFPMIQIARRAVSGGHFIRCDFRDLGCFQLHSFDGVLCLASLQHVFRSDLGTLLRQINLLLRSNGVMLIITKEGHGLYLDKRLGQQFMRPTTLVTYEELQHHLVDQGFAVVASSAFALEREGTVDKWLAILARGV